MVNLQGWCIISSLRTKELQIMERSGNFLTRNKIVAGVIAGGLLLGACAADTTEGIRTEGCVPVTADFNMSNGDKIYLGDISSDDEPFGGPKSDWGFIENKLGQLTTDNESANDVNGVFTQHGSDEIEYREKGKSYDIKIGEITDDNVLPVTITTNC